MKTKKPIFCIQKHAARNLHYDFRLEVDGVLKSWVVRKGPSLDPKDKRLAIMTIDHALSYANFEGVIPKGKYGAGVVMIWDHGVYRNIKMKDGALIPMKQCLKNGQIEVFLEGERLMGGYALVKLKGEHWLLIKMRDEYVDVRINLLESEANSVKTGRSLEEIKKIIKS
jgi:DNA ligase D-like protein (predicted 3'-phosphoesterase)